MCWKYFPSSHRKSPHPAILRSLHAEFQLGCRRFGTHCRFHLHRQVNEVCQWKVCVGYLYLVGLERGSGRANRKQCARTRRLEVQQVVEGEGVYKCVCGWVYYCVLDRCLLSLSFWSCGFHDLLRLKPPCLFMLFGCISISMSSLMRRSM